MQAIKKRYWIKILRCLKNNFHFLLLFIGLVFASYEFSLFRYIQQQFFHYRSTYFQSSYIDPKKIKFTTRQPKSLVVIYVESLENTYSNQKIFGQDLLHDLNSYKAKGVSFTKYTPMPGTEWTIAGLVATQCGVPLKTVTVFGNNRQGEILNHFLPKAKCLGDILADYGYQNVFINGTSLKFAGVGEFFKDHHYSELYGKDEWLVRGYKLTDMSSWGLHDDDLFKEAKSRLVKLVREKKPFNLTILTIDTHGSDGYPGKTCLTQAQGSHDFPKLVKCTSNQVANFIEFIRRQGWLKKLNVVVMGDHLAMKNKVYDQLESAPSRFIYNLIISDRSLHKNTNEVVGFDMLPTMLDSIGIYTKNGRVALGYSAISPYTTSQPANRLEKMREKIGDYSEAYNQLW